MSGSSEWTVRSLRMTTRGVGVLLDGPYCCFTLTAKDVDDDQSYRYVRSCEAASGPQPRHTKGAPVSGRALLDALGPILEPARTLRYQADAIFDDVPTVELEVAARALRAISYSCITGAACPGPDIASEPE